MDRRYSSYFEVPPASQQGKEARPAGPFRGRANVQADQKPLTRPDALMPRKPQGPALLTPELAPRKPQGPALLTPELASCKPQGPVVLTSEPKSASLALKRYAWKYEGHWQNVVAAHRKGDYASMPALAQALAGRFVTFVTDRGKVIKLFSYRCPALSDADIEQAQREELHYLLRHGLAGKVKQLGWLEDRCNCWGFTFTGGTGWIDGPRLVQAILNDNGFYVTLKPRIGDIIVYRKPDTSELDDMPYSGNGDIYNRSSRPAISEITHTGIVARTELLRNGRTKVVTVHSKWGEHDLYSHPPDIVPPGYGTWQVYHSQRPGGSLLTPEPLARIRARQVPAQHN